MATSPPPPPPLPKPRLLLVLHGKAAGDPGVRAAVSTIAGIDVRPTYSAGDARTIVLTELAAADAGARPPVATIVAGGGDGTLTEVIQAVLAHQNKKIPKTDDDSNSSSSIPGPPPPPSLAMLLAGTANDLGSAAGVSADPLQALRLAADPSRARPVDLALCNGVPFVNVATAGPPSAVSSAGMSESLKRLLGPLSVPVAGLAQLLTPASRHSVLRPQPVTLVFPTAKDVPEPPLAGGGGGGPGRGGRAEEEEEAAAAGVAEAAASAAAAATAAGSTASAFGGPAAGGGEGEGEGEAGTAAAAAAAAEMTTPTTAGAAAEAAVAGPPAGATKKEEKDQGVVVLPPPLGAAGAAAAGKGGGKVMAVRGLLAGMAVGQARQMGRLINVCPDALLDDGLIDATVLFAPSLAMAAADLARDAIAAIVASAAGGPQPEQQQQEQQQPPQEQQPVPRLAGLCTLRVPWLHAVLEDDDAEEKKGASFGAPSDAPTAAGAPLASAAPSPLAAEEEEAPAPPLLIANLDGEPLVQARALRFSVLPRAVKLHLPDDRLLVSGLSAALAAKAARGSVEGRNDDDAGAEKAREQALLESAAREVSIDFGQGAARARDRDRHHDRDRHRRPGRGRGGGGAAAPRLLWRLARPLARMRGGVGGEWLLRELLRGAKQPPGRLARALPVLMARLKAALVALALIALGAVLGLHVASARHR